MTRLVLAAIAGAGVAFALVPRRQRSVRPRRSGPTTWLRQAGIDDIGLRELLAVLALMGLVGGAAGFALFGGVLAPLACGTFAASLPIASFRQRRSGRMAAAHEAWPAMLEELRVQTSSLGRSIPQALFEVGRRGPAELRAAFDAAQREWMLTTDFALTVQVLKDRLADPTADATLETLLVAHEIGGGGLDRRLAALIEDRIADVQGRKDAQAKQAGVRFARRFVLIVPLGMAFVGLQIGDSRDAYTSAAGQVTVLVAVGLVAACWWWAGRIMRLPSEQQVFTSAVGVAAAAPPSAEVLAA
jgi:tight adherence protein B